MARRYAEAGKVLDIEVAAQSLSTLHPGSGLTVKGVGRMIEESAVRNRAVLLAGRHRPR